MFSQADVLEAFPLDSTEWMDLDGDKLGDNRDSDDDGDGVDDNVDAFPRNKYVNKDIDGDGPPRAPFRVSVCAARALNATGQSRVTLSLR